MRLLLDVNRRAQELTDADPQSAPNASGRINVGIYVFDETERPVAPGGS
jgi:hypothetical protein